MVKIKVSNMITSKGNPAENQFIITKTSSRFNTTEVYFQSYNTTIAYMSEETGVLLDKDSWDCSVTTGKYRNQFLGESIEETRLKIKSGEYSLTNLN